MLITLVGSVDRATRVWLLTLVLELSPIVEALST